MIELCPSWPHWLKKRTIWNHTFHGLQLLKRAGVGRKLTNDPDLELFNLKCSSSMAGLWVTFFFPLLFTLNLMSCTSKAELEHMNGFRKIVSVFLVIW